MTVAPSNAVERVTLYSVPIDLTAEQIEIVGYEGDSVLIGLTQDLAHLDGKPDADGYIEEVAAFGRLAAALTTGTLQLPDRRCRSALERLAAELDGRNDYDRVRAEHEAFAAFVELLRTPRASSATQRRS